MNRYLFIFLLICPFFKSYGQTQTYYETLNVSESATIGDLRKAYRRKAQIYHPDRPLLKGKKIKEHKQQILKAVKSIIAKENKKHLEKEIEKQIKNLEKNTNLELNLLLQTDQIIKKAIEKVMNEHFQKINEAHAILTDTKKRAEYDNLLKKGYKTFREAGKTSGKETNPFSKHFSNTKPFSKNHHTNFSSFSKNANPSISYFYSLLLNNLKIHHSSNPKEIKNIRKTNEEILKNILKSEGLNGLNQQSIKRIGNDFETNFSKKTLENIYKTVDFKSSSSKKQTNQILMESQSQALNELFKDFLSEIKEWYVVEQIKPYERYAVEMFYKLSFLKKEITVLQTETHRYDELYEKNQKEKLTKEEKQELKKLTKEINTDIQTLERVLAHLGFPKVANYVQLRFYIEHLKRALLELDSKGVHSQTGKERLLEYLLKNEKQSSKQHATSTQYIKAHASLQIIRDLKNHFDNTHYENLRNQIFSKNTLISTNFLKSFGLQFVLFNAAIGASIYREYLTDPLLYETHRNPESSEDTFKHMLSPQGVLSFAIFVGVSQKVHQGLYALGRSLDGKQISKFHFHGGTVKRIAPGAGLGLGFFASTLFDSLLFELKSSGNLSKCIKKQFKNDKNLFENKASMSLEKHNESCEAFINEWFTKDKWKHIGVDITLLIASGMISHSLVASGFRFLQPAQSFLLKYGLKFGKMFSFTWAGAIAKQLINFYAFLEMHKLAEEYLGKPLKEQLTAGGIKNSLLHHSNYLDKSLSSMTHLSLLNQENIEKHFEDLKPEFKKQVTKLGHQFTVWSRVRNQYYAQSFHFWSQKTNRFMLPYEGAKKFLQKLFNESNQKYDLKEETSLYDIPDLLALDKGLFFSTLNFENLNSNQKNKYCSFVDKNNFFTQWTKLCKNGYQSMDFIEENSKQDLLFESAKILQQLMESSESEKIISNSSLRFTSYIGLSFKEMFSSHPDFLVQSLSVKEKFQLSKELITRGLDWKKLLTDFNQREKEQLYIEYCKDNLCEHLIEDLFSTLENKDPVKTERESLSYCNKDSLQKANLNLQNLEEGSEPIELKCLLFESIKEQLAKKLSKKILKSGFYLLKETLNLATYGLDGSHSTVSVNPSSKGLQNTALVFRPEFEYLKSLTNLFEVYKKGEEEFVKTEKIFLEHYKNTENPEYFLEAYTLGTDPYRITYQLICDKKEKEDFHIPVFFHLDNWFFYDIAEKKFNKNKEQLCKEFKTGLSWHNSWLDSNSHNKLTELNKILFNLPVKIQGELYSEDKTYENLYLALESFLNQNYTQAQDIENHFQSLSHNQLEKVADKTSKALGDLTESYYKEMVNLNSTVDSKSSLKEFDLYYDKNKIFFDIRSFTGEGLGVLEISIMQINYWMNTLKKLLIQGENVVLKKESLNNEKCQTSAFEKKRQNHKQQHQTSFNEHYLYMECAFNLYDFEKMRLEVLSLLQSYHNSYKQSHKAYLTYPDKNFIQELKTLYTEQSDGLKEKYGTSNRFHILKNSQNNNSAPIFMDSEILLSHILEHSIPNWNNPWMMETFKEDPKLINSPWKNFITPIIYELNKSLTQFFFQMEILNSKEGFENQLKEAHHTF